MKAWACLTWLSAVAIAGGCKPRAPAAGDAPGPVERVERPDQKARDPFEGLDPKLSNEIRAWKKGDPPPAQLLRFPDGPPPDFVGCGMRALGDEVGDYIGRIADPDLLAALLFDLRADDACARATARRLLEVRGVRGVRALLADRRRAAPGDLNRREVATLAQLLTGPYARIKVASIAKADVKKDAAGNVLAGLRADLTGGRPWADAYLRAADRLPDMEASKQARGGWRTFVRFAYDGLVAPIGFDLLDRRLALELDPDHLRRLFAAKGGTHIWETADAYWLYHAEAFDE